MPRIEVRIMELEEREQFTLSGGTKQDRARALFIALLPDDGTCYTAAEVVKYSLGRKEDHDHYVAHYKALDSLARVHGIGDGKIPGPDNVDPATNKRLPGKKRGTLQPCRWNRSSWLNIVSDEIYAWLRELNQKLKELAKDQPAGTRLFCELDRFDITVEAPATPAPRESLTDERRASLLRHRRNWPRIAALGGLAAAIFFTVIFWPTSQPSPIEKLAVQDVDFYLKQNKPQIKVYFSVPFSEEILAAKWKVSKPLSTEMLAMASPPPMFIAGNR